MDELFRIIGDDSGGCPEPDSSKGSIAVDDLNISCQWTISDFCEIIHSDEWRSELKSPPFQVFCYPDVLFKICFSPCAKATGGIRKYSLILKAVSRSSNKMGNRWY
uniref:MATH domain-containing protein n=1 Tax=Strongyloides papillosus TaxID=174720 RepID=A0A0N5CGP4_STREA